MAEMKISNTLVNDTSDKTIAYAEQLKQQIINWAEYNHVTEKLGPNNRPSTQNLLNNLFLRVYEEFLTFLNNADATDQAINTWKEIEAFLAGYTDDKTLASIVAQLNANIESRLNVQLANETGDSTTTTMTQKAITEAIDYVASSVQNELALGAVYDVSAKNPTAGPNNDGKFESLSALLSDANLNTLIPTAVRKGGMSIKFVQSSDNKYVQFRLTADEWSASPFDWIEADSNTIVGKAFYVTDGNGNIIAKVDKDGVHSVDFKIGQEGTSVATALGNVVTQISAAVQAEENRAKAVEAAKLDATISDNAFYITDSNGYIICKIDSEGIHAAQSKYSVACMVLSDNYYPTAAPTRDGDGNVTHAEVMFATGVAGEIDITYTNGNSSSVGVTYGRYTYTITITRDGAGNVETVSVS